MLLDTNIVSELARKSPNSGVVAFLKEIANPKVSVMLFHELVFGVEKADPSRRLALGIFIDDVRRQFAADAIPVDMQISETAAKLRAFNIRQGRVLSVSDSLMAATAMVHDVPLVTRNVKDFEKLSIRLINPFEE